MVKITHHDPPLIKLTAMPTYSEDNQHIGEFDITINHVNKGYFHAAGHKYTVDIHTKPELHARIVQEARIPDSNIITNQP